MFYNVFLSPQVKRCASIADKFVERPKTQDLRKLGNIGKVSKPHRMIV